MSPALPPSIVYLLSCALHIRRDGIPCLSVGCCCTIMDRPPATWHPTCAGQLQCLATFTQCHRLPCPARSWPTRQVDSVDQVAEETRGSCQEQHETEQSWSSDAVSLGNRKVVGRHVYVTPTDERWCLALATTDGSLLRVSVLLRSKVLGR
ncbi:hypothetical protein LX36DRAFT_151694 [Colletotrichum falcatum]|nr:hypothetical protein LX36DRAFT_151694 [Colletotrichum falcatum]